MIQRIQSLFLRRQRRRELEAHVAALGEARFDGYRCVVQAGLTRVFVSLEGAGEIRLRVPADFALDPHLSERESVATRLAQDGFVLAPGASGLEWQRSGRRVLPEIEDLLFERLGLPADVVYSVAVEHDRQPDNPELRERMLDLAQEHSHRTRAAVYRALLDATLLLAVERREGGLHAVADADELQGQPTWLAFSGPEAASNHEQVFDVVSVFGVRLVRASLGHPVGALRLDFGSRVGGELYASELRSIAQSIPAARPPGF